MQWPLVMLKIKFLPKAKGLNKAVAMSVQRQEETEFMEPHSVC